MTQSHKNIGLTELEMKNMTIKDLEDRLAVKNKRYAVRPELVVETALVHGTQDESTKAISFTPEKLDEFVRVILSKAIRGY